MWRVWGLSKLSQIRGKDCAKSAEGGCLFEGRRAAVFVRVFGGDFAFGQSGKTEAPAVLDGVFALIGQANFTVRNQSFS